MKKDNKILEKVLAGAALQSAKSSANKMCSWIFYQDKEPAELKKLRKF